jgi:hypothetical protein
MDKNELTKSNRGRKSKLTRELIRKMTELLATGSYAYRVAEACGINEATYYEWLSIGEKTPTGIYAEFYDAVKQAEAKAEMVKVNQVSVAGETDWRAAAWFLSHKHRERWGDKQQVDVTGSVQMDMDSFKEKLLSRIAKEAGDE